jgi:hypothetical protein
MSTRNKFALNVNLNFWTDSQHATPINSQQKIYITSQNDIRINNYLFRQFKVYINVVIMK